MIQIASFNCNSIRRNVDTVRSLLKSNDFVALQELMICESDVEFLSTIDNEFYYHAFVKDKILDGINTGRPSKGVAIFWKKSIMSVTSININEWMNGITFDTNIGRILFLNVYLPCDMGSYDSLHEFRSALAILSGVIDDCDINNILIIGDFNADPCKGRFWKELETLISNYNLNSEVGHLNPSDFTFLSPSHNTTSYIDHLLCSTNSYEKLLSARVNYDLSLYDHFPLEIVFNIDIQIKPCPAVINSSKFIDWNNLNNNDLITYRKNIDNLLLQPRMGR